MITVLLWRAIYRRVVHAQVVTLHAITKLNFVGFWKTIVVSFHEHIWRETSTGQNNLLDLDSF